MTNQGLVAVPNFFTYWKGLNKLHTFFGKSKGNASHENPEVQMGDYVTFLYYALQS